MARNDYDATLEQRRDRGGRFEIFGDRRTKRLRTRTAQKRNAINDARS